MAMKCNNSTRRKRPYVARSKRHGLCVSLLTTAPLAVTIARSQEVYGNSSSEREGGRCNDPSGACGLPSLATADDRGEGVADWSAVPESAADIDYGNHNLEWEDGPSSWEEFGHDNDPSVCGVQRLTVAEWEAGRYWKKNRPVIVTNATAGWAAMHRWRK